MQYYLKLILYTQVPGVSRPVDNHFCSDSTRCFFHCETLFSWCKSVFRRMGLSGMVNTLDTTVGGGSCLWDSEARVRNSLRLVKQIAHSLPPVHGDMFPCLLQAKLHCVMLIPHHENCTHFIYFKNEYICQLLRSTTWCIVKNFYWNWTLTRYFGLNDILTRMKNAFAYTLELIKKEV